MASPKRKSMQKEAAPGKPIACKKCQSKAERSALEESLWLCPACGRHFPIGAHKRIAYTADEASFVERHGNIETVDPLSFHVGKETYVERVARARKASGLREALLTGCCNIGGMACALGVMDSRFIMASMGSVLGEKFCRLAGDAITRHCPLVVFAASGGARMQEGTLALMQMAKTAEAVRAVKAAGLPFVSVLTDPTSGGVYASFASLGDIVIAEPGAYIGFAGTRLIEGALKVKIPEGFQTAEYQFNNGFLDDIVPRPELPAYLARLLRCIAPGETLPARKNAS